MSRLADIERARFADQLRFARSWLNELEATPSPEDAATRFALEQTRRNIERLEAASEGRTPSAVVDRAQAHPHDDAAERLALARDEAIHTADNVAKFADRLESDTSEASALRCARWLLRLRLEVLDALPDVSPDPSELALALASADDASRSLRVDDVRVALTVWLDALRA